MKEKPTTDRFSWKWLVPEGKRPTAYVDHFTVTPEGSMMHFMHIMDNPQCRVPPGEYCRLVVEGNLVMTNTRWERYSQRRILDAGIGDVLIGGLGLGCVTRLLLNRPDVTSVTVIEKNKDVIELVAPHCKHPKLRVIHGDVFDVPVAGQKFDAIWMDIWNEMNADHAPQKRRLAALYQKCKRHPESFVGSWSVRDQ